MHTKLTRNARTSVWLGTVVLCGAVGSVQAQQAVGHVTALPEVVAAAATQGMNGAVVNSTAVDSTAVDSTAVDTTAVDANLPDAPEVSSSLVPAEAIAPQSQAPGAPGSKTPRIAGKYDTVILPGQTAARLTVHDKVIFGIKDSISPFSAIGWVLSAGYEQVTDGSPNYGVLNNTQTAKSFAQRLGAAAARDTSETIFSESILAPILHEDPRYYAQTNRNFFYRVIYAGTRPLITRTNGGRTTINLSQLGGNLAGSALTQAYYPPINQGFTEVMKTFGGSVGGSAVGDLASEFLPGLLETLHFKKRQ